MPHPFTEVCLPLPLRAAVARCPACGPSLFVALGAGEMATRCVRCRATPVTLSLVSILRPLLERHDRPRVYELSSRGALVRFLRASHAELTISEFYDDVPPGSSRDGIRCEDVMSLTWPDASFDICTSTEVFEHVPDDLRGFREMHRVLRPGGWLVFTVPLADAPTLTRALPGADGPRLLMEPEYHGDRIRGSRGVLCYRTYGPDIVERLREAGFASAALETPPTAWLGHRRTVVVARKAGAAGR